MRIKTIILFLLCVCSSGYAGYAQAYKVQGSVFNDKSRQPIDFSTVTIVNSEDSIISSVITDVKGIYNLDLPNGEYRLMVKSMGFNTVSRDLIVSSEDVFVKNIYLEEDLEQLDEVMITGRSRTQKFDRTVQLVTRDMRVGAGTAADILGKVPGINIDKFSNKITVNNKDNVLVLVDGVRKNEGYIKDIAPDRINSIEVIQNPTGRYLSEGYSALINVVLKKDYSGISVGLEDQSLWSMDRGNGGDLFIQNNLDFNIDYTRKKINVYSRYSNSTENIKTLSNSYELLNGNYLIQKPIGAKHNVEQKGLTHDFTLGTDVFISRSQTLSVELNHTNSPLAYNENKLSALNNRKFNSNTLEYRSDLYSPESANMLYSLIAYRYQISDNDRLELDYSLSHLQNKSKSEYSDELNNYLEQNASAKNLTSILDLYYTHNFSSKFEGELGYKNTFKRREYDYRNIESSGIDSDDNKDFRNFIYGNIGYAFNENLHLKMGLGIEFNKLRVDEKVYETSSLNPYLNVFFKPSNNFNLQLSLNSHNDYPEAEHVAPYQTPINILSSKVGNPKLTFSTKYNSELQLNFWGDRISITPYYSYINNNISRVGSVSNEQFLYSYANIDRYESKGVRFALNLMPIPNRLVFNLSSDFYWQNTKVGEYENTLNDYTLYANSYYIFHKLAMVTGMQLQNNNSKKISAYGYDLSDNDYLLLFAQKSLLNQRFNILLGYMPPIDGDVFNYSQGRVFNKDGYSNENSYAVSLLKNCFIFKISYNFNRGKAIKGVGKKDHKERVGSDGIL